MDITKYNFPEGTTLEIVKQEEKDFFTISYSSSELIETVFGLMPQKSFSTGNYVLQVAVDTFIQTIESNGYNFETKTWQ